MNKFALRLDRRRSLAAERRTRELELIEETDRDMRRERQISRRCWWTPPFGHVWDGMGQCANCGLDYFDHYDRENSTGRVWALYIGIALALYGAWLLFVMWPYVGRGPLHGMWEYAAAIVTAGGGVAALIAGFAFCMLVSGAFGPE